MYIYIYLYLYIYKYIYANIYVHMCVCSSMYNPNQTKDMLKLPKVIFTYSLNKYWNRDSYTSSNTVVLDIT